MKILKLLFLFAMSMYAAQNSDDAISETPPTVYFDEALIYSYKSPDRQGEFWIYHNSETGNFLYIPNDEMIDFVIADSLGNYYVFGNNGHDEKVVSLQQSIFIEDGRGDAERELPESDDFIEFIELPEKKVIDQSNIVQPNIHSKGFTMHYKKMMGQQNVFITEDISLNSNIIYGFNTMDGDVKLPVAELNFTNIFSKNQVVTHINRDNFMLELENFGPNPYWATVGDYNYYIQDEKGTWIKKPLPLVTD
ncbi:hypothetical protein QRD02_06520 [Aequorivita sp. SDUM287046]|uniref:WG repeat-containing protein n=1 Tax=Aequorivita aurantiaca TaxID=3053356 RepID=A0ABT8DJF5_9FLAO|nr:hypothetical protein [Aequorivita aurantiaca]MDN3724030.1 hypothetical protein [Aequorivita aurantiaca]